MPASRSQKPRKSADPDAPKRPRGRPRKARPVAIPLPADGQAPEGYIALPPPPAGSEEEWAGYSLQGSEETVSRKRRLLAQIEGTYEIGPACGLVGVPRYLAQEWLVEDDEFARAVDDCREHCRQRAGSLMFQAGLTPIITREGNSRVNAQALIMFLNAQDPDYGLIKAQAIERRDARLVQRACEVLQETIPTETVERVRETLDRICYEEMVGVAPKKGLG